MKTYLDVPYAEKDFAKRYGAKWDSAAKKWYVSGSEPIPYMLRRFMNGYKPQSNINAQYQFMRGMP